MSLSLDLVKEVSDVGAGLLGGLGLVGWRVGVCGGNAGLEQGAGELRDFEVFGVDVVFECLNIVFEGADFKLILVFDLIDGGLHFLNIISQEFTFLVFIKCLLVFKFLQFLHNGEIDL